MELGLESQQFAALGLEQSTDRDTGRPTHHFCDVLLVDLFFEHRLLRLQLGESGSCLFDLALQAGQSAESNLGCLLEVGFSFEVSPLILMELLEQADLADGILLVLPMGLHGLALLAEIGQFGADLLGPLHRQRVGLFRQSHLLHLELSNATLDNIDLGRQRIDLDAELRMPPRR